MAPVDGGLTTEGCVFPDWESEPTDGFNALGISDPVVLVPNVPYEQLPAEQQGHAARTR